jgi:hypothetical protein
MFKPFFILTILLSLVSSNAAKAAVTFQLDPAGGAISGQAGNTVGWGFSLSNTENFLVVTGASFEPVADLGTFTDFISAPDNFFVIGPGLGVSTTWSQTFDASKQTGMGSFAISSSATPGSSVFGQIILNYDLFSVNPLDPNFNPDTDTLSNGNLISSNASVTNSVVPLPAAAWLFLTGLGGVCFGVRKQTI